MSPLAIDLFCGLGGWTEGLLAEGWRVVGFDIEKHEYGDQKYPAQLVIQDVLTIHGSQFRDARLIVASPPCQEFSYMAMPWSRAKEKQRRIEADAAERKRLTALFDACFRIQREACEAAGRHIPLVVENVRGAQKWVGRAAWNFGSFYLWGDVPALMPIARLADGVKAGDRNKARSTGGHEWTTSWDDGHKVPGFRFDGSGRSFQTASVEESGIKGIPHRTKGHRTNPAEHEGIKQGGDWFNASQPSISRICGSKSNARKAASAQIAKIPLTLSRHIGAVYR